MPVDTTARLSALRKNMQQHGLSHYIVPSEDAHASEYTAACDERRAYISGFDGSAGLAIVAQKGAYLFTDGRYFNQAAQQLDASWTLMKQGMPDVPTWQEFLIKAASSEVRVGIDAALIPYKEALGLKSALAAKGGVLVGLSDNLVDEVWSGRDSPLANSILVHPTELAGRSVPEKLSDLRKTLSKHGAMAIVLTSVDEVAWLFNLRGSDVPFNPVFFCYAIITLHDSMLFLRDAQASEQVRQALPSETHIKPYESILSACKELGHLQGKVFISARGSWAIATAVGDHVDVIRSPIADAKSIKNDVELEGMRKCHVRDGAALTEYLQELDELAKSGKAIDEVDAATILENKRRARPLFVGLSFPTISSTGANGAIIHYKPEKETCATIDWSQIYLCDSGAQYKDGTTDITRTWHYGTPTAFEKRAFTLVLKGHIAIASATFPRGTTGYTLDPLARQYLWAEGLDYFHGTSHGVGSYLNVHEAPLGIGTRITFNEVAFSPGNIISNEPGFYKDGAFGIRIENIIACVKKDTAHRFGDRDYLGFETISFAPLCRNLIETSLLSEQERAWVDDYHGQVFKLLKPEVQEQSLAWLESECASLDL